mgnify:CR=1 FL=1
MVFQNLIRSSEDDTLFGGFTADCAFVADGSLVERHVAGGNLHFLFQLVLAFAATAPHTLGKVTIVDGCADFFHI